MFSQDKIEIINRLLNDYAATSPTILGARIGDIVKKEFPGENIKTNYGSVKNFIEQHFANILTYKSKYGVDNLYNFSDLISQPVGATAINELEEELGGDPQIPASIIKPNPSILLKDKNVSISVLRAAIKDSINLMTLEQLRQLAIPAGILFDAINKTNRS